MKPIKFLQSISKNLVFAIAILFFTCQNFGANSNNSTTSKKSQVQKQPDKKTVPAKPSKPKASPLSFRPDMPLREAIEILRNSTDPPLNIVVLWKDLEDNADITGDTPIGINGASGVSLKTNLNLLLWSLSSTGLAELGYTIDGSIIIIATKDSLPKKMTTVTYNISDLVAPLSGTMMPGIGMGNLMGTGMGMGTEMSTMPYGNMMQYGTYGMNNGYSEYNQYMNPGYQNQGYINQGVTPYNNLNNLDNIIGMVPRF
jgi:hypothetical protein